jgi:hypothetical protein
MNKNKMLACRLQHVPSSGHRIVMRPWWFVIVIALVTSTNPACGPLILDLQIASRIIRSRRHVRNRTSSTRTSPTTGATTTGMRRHARRGASYNGQGSGAHGYGTGIGRPGLKEGYHGKQRTGHIQGSVEECGNKGMTGNSKWNNNESIKMDTPRQANATTATWIQG